MASKTQMQEQLQELKGSLVKMSNLVEERLHEAIESLIKRDSQLAQQVIDRDDEVDRFDNFIDDLCLRLLRSDQTKETDLRFITMAMKMVTELERMGDHAVNVAKRAISLNETPQVKPYIDLPRMAEIVQSMVKDVMDAFLNHNAPLARSVWERDDLVDSLNDQIFRELITYTTTDPSTSERAIHLVIVSRYLERIADHATNIAEHIIFIETGETIKHQAKIKDFAGKKGTSRPAA
jgi:phosphate transport system protein